MRRCWPTKHERRLNELQEHEAKAMVAVLQAHFPNPEIPPSTARAWSKDLEELPLDADDVMAAISSLSKRGIERNAPVHISHVIAEAESLWADRYQLQAQEVEQADRRAELEAVIPASEAEQRAIFAAYWDRIGVEGTARAKTKRQAEGGDTEARIEATRHLARAQIEAAASKHDERDGQLTPRRVVDSGEPLRTGCGVVAGTPTVWDESLGKAVCPKCGSPVEDGCAPRREESA